MCERVRLQFRLRCVRGGQLAQPIIRTHQFEQAQPPRIARPPATPTSDCTVDNRALVDPDKIICWEHPNFADEILGVLDARLERQRVGYWPLPLLPLVDPNLIIRFQYRQA